VKSNSDDMKTLATLLENGKALIEDNFSHDNEQNTSLSLRVITKNRKIRHI